MNAAACFLCWVLADPPPGDWYRLPPLPELQAAVLFNGRYQGYLRDALEFGEPDRRTFREAEAEAEALRRVWDDAWGSHPDYECGPEPKAAYRRRLRLALGRDAFLRMEMPPAAPYWRFGEMRR